MTSRVDGLRGAWAGFDHSTVPSAQGRGPAWGANLSGANLSGANLGRDRGTRTCRARTWRGRGPAGADLQGREPAGADLWGANLSARTCRGGPAGRVPAKGREPANQQCSQISRRNPIRVDRDLPNPNRLDDAGRLLGRHPS